MPAARPAAPGLIEQLNASAPKRAANNALPISNYYRSCDLLISQAHVYRASGNDEQLYVMLMRFASLVIETLPKHAQFNRAAPEYQRLNKHAAAVVQELEHIKAALKLRNVERPAARTTNRPADAALLVTSNLPEIDWGSLGSAPSAPPPPSDSLFGAEAAEWLARASGAAAGAAAAAASWGGSGGASFTAAGPSWGGSGSASFGALPPPPAAAGASGSFTSAGSGSFTGRPAYQSAYLPSSQQSLDKHSLFGPRSSPGSGSGAAAPPPPRPRYPGFDATPAAAIDLLWAPQKQQQEQQQQDGEAHPSAPPEGALAALPLAERRASGAAAGSLLDAPMAPHPSAGPSLGPQEAAVFSMDAGHGHAGGTCAAPPLGQQLVPAEPGGGGGVRPLEKRMELRDVHISVALMNDFLHYASSNTRRGIESCGILAGTLTAGDSIFRVTTLIIPKQEGTSDTVAALNEEEIFEAQFSRELYPLGWIHTHPTQTCFLSSVDVHTQCGYQTMLDEAVAIVMAPTDSRNKCGIFRLTTPGGLQLIQKCPQRGFHMHPPTATGQEVYELCGHVYLNPRTKHEVLDLR